LNIPAFPIIPPLKRGVRGDRKGSPLSEITLKASLSQEIITTNWVSMLRSHYNFCLRDRIEAYEQVKYPKLGNYSDLKTKAPCCPLTCSISPQSQLGEPFKKSGKKRNAYEMQSSELPFLKQARPWYKKIHSTVLQQNLRRLKTDE